MKRREFLTSTIASMAMGQVALAHSPAQYDEMIPPSGLPESMLPRIVDYPEVPVPGEIHVNPNRFALYWTLGGGTALRYSVGIGRQGLYEPGEFYVAHKRKWPPWTPTPGMIEREPEKYARYADGMPGGPNNPLGARALYLFDQGGWDTYLRIHGTDDPSTIGQRVSNGCARLTNDQIVEFYDLVPIGTRVVLQPVNAEG
ncbi:MAG: hypothetical protein CML61_02385 [Rhodobacteraceae bacterium]|nr:hypothetical protein [Paracoccaceae bacterium]